MDNTERITPEMIDSLKEGEIHCFRQGTSGTQVLCYGHCMRYCRLFCSIWYLRVFQAGHWCQAGSAP